MKRNLRSLIFPLAPSLVAADDQVQSALAGLSERERTVLELRFGLKDGQSYSLQAVGETFGITGERVRQIEARALGKLRRLARAYQQPVINRRARAEAIMSQPV